MYKCEHKHKAGKRGIKVKAAKCAKHLIRKKKRKRGRERETSRDQWRRSCSSCTFITNHHEHRRTSSTCHRPTVIHTEDSSSSG